MNRSTLPAWILKIHLILYIQFIWAVDLIVIIKLETVLLTRRIMFFCSLNVTAIQFFLNKICNSNERDTFPICWTEFE